MKKKTLLFLFIFINSTILLAQPYQSLFGINQTSWNMTHIDLTGNYTDSLFVNGDTIINGSIWKRVFDYEIDPPYQPYLLPDTLYIKEDTINGRAWAFSNIDTTTHLIMDLSLTLSDSFDLRDYDNVTSHVDSVYYIAGRKYIRFDYLSLYYPDSEKFTMIEGTGTNAGIGYKSGFGGGLWPYLLCQSKDFLTTYTGIAFGGLCDINTGISEISIDNEIIVYPNPADDKLNIQTIDKASQLQFSEYVIENLMGQVIYNRKIDFLNDISIDVSGIAKGVYLIKLKERNAIHIKRLIKI